MSVPLGELAEANEQHLLRRLFDAMPQLGWTAQPDGFIDYYNRGWYAYTGTTYEDMKGWGWTSVHDPAQLPRVMETWTHALATGTPWELEFPLRRHDGVFRWFLSRATPIYDDGGTLLRWVGINTDIDAQKQAEARLAELDRAKTAFFSNVSHELRTPLTLILGPAEDALRSEDAAMPRENVALVHRNGVRLLELVNALLDFTRLEAGRAQPSFQPTDLARVTRALAAAFASSFDRVGVPLVVDCAAIDAPVYVDRAMWDKLVLNLLSNALKYTLEGRVTLTLAREDGQVVLEVTDTGTGISESELPKIFERFHRVPGAGARSAEGTGIGLALVREIARLHGGEVFVRSAVGRGSTFTVRVPLGSDHLPREQLGAASTAPTTDPAPLVQGALHWLPTEQKVGRDDGAGEAYAVPESVRGLRVLLADDNGDLRGYVGRVLEQNWTVDAVADGRAALDAARRVRPDLILTDVMMPVLDGYELLRAVRADDALRDVPVIMLSARADDEKRAEGLEAGAEDYLAKPFSARELVARVATHLELARLRGVAERARERMRGMLEQAPTAIAVLEGPEHRFSLANACYCKLVGQEAPQLLGRTLLEAFPYLRERPDLVAPADTAFREGTHVEEKEFPGYLPRPDGSLEARYFNFVVDPMRDLDGGITGIISVQTDVTDQVRARTELESARREAESANRAKDEFLAMLGHELRNPLAPILTAIALMRAKDVEATQRELDVIERQAKHLVRLVDDLLDVERVARGKIELVREDVEVADVVRAGLELASPLLESARHHVQVSVPPRGLQVDGDRSRLAQVMGNLLTNSAKYTPPGGQIAITATTEDGEVLVRLSDSGIGISEELLPRIFDMFSQAAQGSDRSGGGLGLGLAVVKGIVDLHGGSVTASSPGPGQGSTFTVRLPLSPRRTASDTARPASERPRPSSARRVMIVDDNIDAAEMLAEFVAALGHEARVAHDGPSALALAKKFAPDAALLDIGLPVMDGYELARRLRAETERPLLMVAVTGYGQEEDRRRSMAAGFAAHLVKPVDTGRVRHLLAGGSDAETARA